MRFEAHAVAKAHHPHRHAHGEPRSGFVTHVAAGGAGQPAREREPEARAPEARAPEARAPETRAGTVVAAGLAARGLARMSLGRRCAKSDAGG
jgi:hypothetical protein